MGYYVDVIKNYVNFSGRASRKEYWMFVLFNYIITLGLAIIFSVIAGATEVFAFSLVPAIYQLFIILPSLAVTVRRLHDINKSGAWIFISFVPLIGSIWLFVLTCLDSVKEGNTY